MTEFPLIHSNDREADTATSEAQWPLVEALRAALPVCPMHGLPTDDLSWTINTYVCDPWMAPDRVWWTFFGWHEELPVGDDWCFAADAYVKPSGAVLLPRDERGW